MDCCSMLGPAGVTLAVDSAVLGVMAETGGNSETETDAAAETEAEAEARSGTVPVAEDESLVEGLLHRELMLVYALL